MRVLDTRLYRELARQGRQDAAERRRFNAANPQFADDRLKPATVQERKVAGIGSFDAKRFLSHDTLLGAAAPGFKPLALLASVPYQVGRATVEDPGKTLPATGRGIRDLVVGIPSAALTTITDPKGAAEGGLRDYARRYGPLLEGDAKQFRERIKKEGFASELLDSGGASSVAGRTLGVAARGSKLMAAARPLLRESGGIVRPQRVSKNLYVAAGQRALDYRRRRKTERRTDQAQRRGTRLGPMDADVRSGEVLPLRRGRNFGGLKGRQARDVAGRKSRGVHALKAEQGREVGRARRTIASLSSAERAGVKYAVQIGVRDAAGAVRHLRARRVAIVAARRERGTVIPKVLERTNDELRHIDWLLEHADQAFTPRLAEAVESLRGQEIAIARRDPGLASEQRLLRRYAQQAEHLGIRRGGSDEVGPKVAELAEHETQAASRLRAAEGRLQRAAVAEAHAEGVAREQASAARRMGRRAGGLSDQLRTDLTRQQGERLMRAHQERMQAEREVRALRGHATAATAARKVAEASHAAPGPSRRRGEGRTTLEPVGRFVRRVQRAAEREGLGKPAYFPSEKRPTIRYSDYALGGTKAAADDKRYSGELFRTGREDARAEVFAEGVARSIKRRHNWRAVTENFQAHTFAWGRNKTLAQLRDELDRRGIDPREVAFWNPGKYRTSRNQFEREGRDLPDVDEPGTYAEPALYEAVQEASADFRKAQQMPPDEFRNTSGWSVVPKAVYDEIHADVRPSSAAARSWDVAKGKQARVLLGAGNLPWLQMQVASNTLLTALARTGPIGAMKAQVWWHQLSRAEKEAVEPYVGLGPFAQDVAQTKLGASTNNRLANGYRAFKQSPLFHGRLRVPGVTSRTGRRGPSVAQLNPLDALFRFDHAQNEFFRKAVLYKQLNREAYRRLGENVGRLGALQTRLSRIFRLAPEPQMRALLRDRRAIEEHASYVNKMLGDYATYTARERRILQRGIMFYGFLRYSLNFAFHTMPTRHPVMTALLGNLARLQTEEVRELLGGDELPFALGRIYYTKDGKLKQVDVTHANPAANVFTDAVSSPNPLSRAVSLLPPIVGMAAEQAFTRSAFTGKTYRVEGQTGFEATQRESLGLGVGLTDRGRIFLSDALRLAYPYRLAEKFVYGGAPQGDDSLLWDPRPTRYKDEEILAGIAKERRRTEAQPVGHRLAAELVPFLPQDSRDPEIAASIRERRREALGLGKGETPSLIDGGRKRSKSLLDSTKRTTSLLDK